MISSKDRELDNFNLALFFWSVWDRRKFIYYMISIGFCIGIIIALVIPTEYKSTATLLPEYNTDGQGGAAGLLKEYGGLLGINSGTYNSSSNAIRIDIYPKIVESITFQDKIASTKFYFAKEDTMVSLYTYYSELAPGLFSNILSGIKKAIKSLIGSKNQDSEQIQNFGEVQTLKFTPEEFAVIQELRERIWVSLDEETGIISVFSVMPERILASEVANFTVHELTKYLTEYRTEKVKRDLEYIESQLLKAEERFRTIQLERADFLDSNQGNLTARFETEKQKLQSSYDISFNVYNTLTQRYEEGKLKVQEVTPVFKILQPVQVPINDEQSGVKIVLLSMFFGGIIGMGKLFLERLMEGLTLSREFFTTQKNS